MMCWHVWFNFSKGLSDYRVCRKCGLLQEDLALTDLFKTWSNKGTVDDHKSLIQSILDDKKNTKEKFDTREIEKAKIKLSWKDLKPIQSSSETETVK